MITEFKAQGFNQGFVEFSKVEVRKIPYAGRAWFLLTRGAEDRVLEVKPYAELQRNWVTAMRSDRTLEDASPTARIKIGELLLAAAWEWTMKNPTAFVEAERKNLGDEVERQLKAKNDAHALYMGLEKELSSARTARLRFEKRYPDEIPQRLAKKVR